MLGSRKQPRSVVQEALFKTSFNNLRTRFAGRPVRCKVTFKSTLQANAQLEKVSRQQFQFQSASPTQADFFHYDTVQD